MKDIFSKLAAALALVIGAMAIFAGGGVLLGRDPGYYVIDWVPVYNFGMGLVSFFVTAVLLWKGSRLALPAALATFGLHTLVMLVLLAGYRGTVAAESITAMTVRLVVWALILILVWAGKRAGAKRGLSTAAGS